MTTDNKPKNIVAIMNSRWSGLRDTEDAVALQNGDTAFIFRAEYAQLLELERIANALEKLAERE